jgi:hypothetical protein
MKICVIGDLHMRFELPYSSVIKDGRRGEWEEIKKAIYDVAEICDAIVLLGDNFNSRHNHSSVIKEFINFLNGFGNKEIHILCGNHERFGEHTALDFLKEVDNPNWHIYTEPTQTHVAGQQAMIIPFMTPALLGVETKEEGVKAIIAKFPLAKFPLAFAHHGISGTTICNGMSIDFFNEIVLPKEVMEQHFTKTFCGHIHEKQNLSPGICLTGNVFTHEVGNHSKSIFVWDSVTETTEEILLPARGIYKIVWEERDEKEVIPSNSIVKCYVTNKETNLGDVKKFLSFFDASIIIEQYPSERQKVHFEDGGLDLSIDSLLKMFADAKKLSYEDLKEGFSLIQ